jgi:hypothetical protein|tara:strand:- start:1126 stop:1530 length:405 start_codon:yes stop_codon:yes gene_type:complete
MASDGDKRILYKNHCTPQEQVGSTDRYYLDSDCGRKLTGSYMYDLDSAGTTVVNTLTSSSAIGTTIDFIAVTATSIIADAVVEISLDNGTSVIIQLLEGECFASKINASSPAAQPYVKITNNSGSASVDYMTGT